MAECVIGIGAQKSGTTTIARELQSHPEFGMSAIKELHYFDSKYLDHFSGYGHRFRKELDRTLDSIRENAPVQERRIEYLRALNLRLMLERKKITYLERFSREFDLASLKYFGEITPAYALLPVDAFQEMKEAAPGTRLIFILRDPIERVRSHAKFEITRGARTVEEVESLFFAQKGAIDRSRYDVTIQRIETVFEEHEVFFGFFEDMIEDPDAFFDRLYRWIGISFRPPARDRHENKSAAITFDFPEEMLWRKLEPTYDFMIRRFKNSLPKAWRDQILRHRKNFDTR